MGNPIEWLRKQAMLTGLVLAYGSGSLFLLAIVILIWAGPTLALVYLAAKIVKWVFGW